MKGLQHAEDKLTDFVPEDVSLLAWACTAQPDRAAEFFEKLQAATLNSFVSRAPGEEPQLSRLRAAPVDTGPSSPHQDWDDCGEFWAHEMDIDFT